MSADSSTWIDFKKLRSQLQFGEVLEHYGVTVKHKGDRATGFCPLPTHQGNRKSPSFSVNLERGIWQCFGCGAKGNVLDFACRMEGRDPRNSSELRTAALKIRDVFKLDGEHAPKVTPRNAASPSKKTLVNEPLDFQLQGLDPKHPYLEERGFTAATIDHFGLGYCNRGMLKGRAAIPLHDLQGRLVGYAGRLTKDKDISEEKPKYLFPGDRGRNGITLQFRKSLLVYNAHQIQKPVDHLFVVEGFPACWWLWQLEYRATIALMGSDCSDKQAEIIVDLVKPGGKVWGMPDGNAAGIRCAHSILQKVSPHRFVRWVQLTDNKQPTDFSPEEIISLFGE